MKLKNKLLPLVGVAALSSAVAPLSIITSCSKENQFKEYDISNGYAYGQEHYEGAEGQNALNQHEATLAFINAVKANPAIFSDDLLSSYYDFYNLQASRMISDNLNTEYQDYFADFTTHITSAKISLTNPTFGMAKVVFPSEPAVEYPVISFKIKYCVEFESQTNGQVGEDTITQKTVYEGEKEIKNLPFYAYLSSDNIQASKNAVTPAKEGNVWSIGIMDIINNNKFILGYYNDWSIKSSYKSTVTRSVLCADGDLKTTVTTAQNSGTYNNFNDLMKLSESERNNILSFDFVSSYLGEVEPAPEVIAHGLSAVMSDDGTGAIIRGLYLPKYGKVKELAQDLVEYVSQHYTIKLKDNDLQFKTTDGYVAKPKGFSILSSTTNILGSTEVIPVELNLTWVGSAPKYVEGKENVTELTIPSALSAIIEYRADKGSVRADETFDTTIYTNNTSVKLSLLPDAEETEEGYFEKAPAKWFNPVLYKDKWYDEDGVEHTSSDGDFFVTIPYTSTAADVKIDTKELDSTVKMDGIYAIIDGNETEINASSLSGGPTFEVAPRMQIDGGQTDYSGVLHIPFDESPDEQEFKCEMIDGERYDIIIKNLTIIYVVKFVDEEGKRQTKTIEQNIGNVTISQVLLEARNNGFVSW